MGRKRNIFIRDFFEYDGEKDESVCKNCGKIFKGSYACNLKRHIIVNHTDLYNEYEQMTEHEDQNDKKVSFRVELSAEEVKNACVSLVTKESLPFSILDSQAFKVLTGQIFKGVNVPSITSKNIMDFVTYQAESIKKNIKICVKGRIVCLKVDIATRHDRSVLGVNIQYIADRQIFVQTLGIIELKRRHTAENLKLEIEKILEEFDMTKAQIYSITTDNGRNMIKADELLSTAYPNAEDNEDIGEESESEFIAHNLSLDNVYGVKCAAHTLQLAIKDFLAESYKDTISHARQVVKALRTPSFRYSISISNLRKPQLDVVTRWNSTFTMLERILALKEFCSEHLEGSLTLSAIEWEEIGDLVAALGPLNSASLKLQQDQLLLGDFYKLWLELKADLRVVGSAISNRILQYLERREPTLLENDTMISALFLDPRLRRLLGKEKKALAKKHLKGIVSRMLSLKKQQINNELPCSSRDTGESPVFIDESSVQSCTSLLGQSIIALEVDLSSDDEGEISVDFELIAARNEIESYKEKRADIDSNLLDYWEGNKHKTPFLYRLAMILHGVPATQVSVERAFSALKLILSDLRYNLSDTNLRKLCFVKLNTN